MESIGLFTPPAQRMSMSWSTFWRRPDEKKLEPLVLSCGSEAMFQILLRERACQQGLPDKRGLPQCLKDCFARVEPRECGHAAEPVELTGAEYSHVAVHEFPECVGVLGDPLGGGVNPI